MNSTEMDGFKAGLNKFSSFTSTQLGCTRNIRIQELIERLLDDTKMMRADNVLNFTERTQMTKINLFQNCLAALADDDYYGTHEKIKELTRLIDNTPAASHNSDINSQ